MLQIILQNHLLLSALILLLLFLLPALVVGNRGVRDIGRPDRRKYKRPGHDRRA